VKTYALLINPYILYSGDRDNIEEGLRIQFVTLMKAKVLSNLPIRFF
jgi:hypothetical protein